jgi:hypothetical protein
MIEEIGGCPIPSGGKGGFSRSSHNETTTRTILQKPAKSPHQNCYP